jgi:hypothetical protein
MPAFAIPTKINRRLETAGWTTDSHPFDPRRPFYQLSPARSLIGRRMLIVSRCYGSLTTFNILFKNKDDQFRSGAVDTPNA